MILPLLLVQVERSLVEKGLNKEYAGMMGVPEFVQASVAFAFTHDSPLFVNKTVSLVSGWCFEILSHVVQVVNVLWVVSGLCVVVLCVVHVLWVVSGLCVVHVLWVVCYGVVCNSVVVGYTPSIVCCLSNPLRHWSIAAGSHLPSKPLPLQQLYLVALVYV